MSKQAKIKNIKTLSTNPNTSYTKLLNTAESTSASKQILNPASTQISTTPLQHKTHLYSFNLLI
jgi:hypothetical protein